MSVNVYRPHVLVLAEDDANRQIANGFLLDPNIKTRNIQVLPSVGGWGKVLESFVSDHVDKLRQYSSRHLVLLIDFDGRIDDRKRLFFDGFPEDVRDRVFLLGTSSEPEPLRADCGKSLEEIGKSLAEECFHKNSTLWLHPLLVHNSSERQRMTDNVSEIIF